MKPGKKLFKVYVLGNAFIEEDTLPLKLLPALRKSFPSIEFIELDPTETLPEEEHFILIDSVLNIAEVSLLEGIDALELPKQYSLHDLDLAWNLKLMQKLGKIKRVSIIGVPAGMNEKKALEDVAEMCKRMVDPNIALNKKDKN